MNEQKTIQFIRLNTRGYGDCMFWAIEQSLNPQNYKETYHNNPYDNFVFKTYRKPIFHYYLDNVKNYFSEFYTNATKTSVLDEKDFMDISPSVTETLVLEKKDLEYVTEINLRRIAEQFEKEPLNNEKVGGKLTAGKMHEVIDNFKGMLPPSNSTDNAIRIIDSLIQYINTKIETGLSVTILAVSFHLLTPSCNMNVSVIPIIRDYINSKREESNELPIDIVTNKNTNIPNQSSKYQQYIVIYLKGNHYESLGRVTESTTENETTPENKTTTYTVRTIFNSNDTIFQEALQNKFKIENDAEATLAVAKEAEVVANRLKGTIFNNQATRILEAAQRFAKQATKLASSENVSEPAKIGFINKAVLAALNAIEAAANKLTTSDNAIITTENALEAVEEVAKEVAKALEAVANAFSTQ